MARPDIYRVMPELQELGLAEKIIDTPTKFKATPIQDCVFLLLHRRDKETSEIKQKANQILKILNDNTTRMTLHEEYPQFVLVPKKEASIKRRRKEIKAAQTSIDRLVSFKMFGPTAVTYHEVIKKALERGVKIRVITEKPENENQIPKIIQEFKKYPSFKLRYILKPPLAIVTIYDRKEILVTTSAIYGLGESPVLWSNNPSLLAIINDFYEILWMTAIEKQQEQ